MSNIPEGKPISWLKSILATIITITVISGLFIFMSYWRITNIDQSLFQVCEGYANEDLKNCIQSVSYQYLLAMDWLSLQFVLYVLTTALIVFLSSKRQVTMPLAQATLIAIASAISLLYMLDPGRIAAISVLFGALLGGLIAFKKTRARFIINH